MIETHLFVIAYSVVTFTFGFIVGRMSAGARVMISPCINDCRLNKETKRCIGCDRTLKEIAEYGQMARRKGVSSSPEQRPEKV